MNCILPRTARKADFGTLWPLSCLWMTAPMSYYVFWCGHSKDSNEWVQLCNCLVGTLPRSHYVMRSFPLCGVRVLYSAQYDLLDNHHHGDRQKNKKTVSWLSSSRGDQRVYSVVANHLRPQYTYDVLQRKCQPKPTNIITRTYNSAGAGFGHIHDVTLCTRRRRFHPTLIGCCCISLA